MSLFNLFSSNKDNGSRIQEEQENTPKSFQGSIFRMRLTECGDIYFVLNNHEGVFYHEGFCNDDYRDAVLDLTEVGDEISFKATLMDDCDGELYEIETDSFMNETLKNNKKAFSSAPTAQF